MKATSASRPAPRRRKAPPTAGWGLVGRSAIFEGGLLFALWLLVAYTVPAIAELLTGVRDGNLAVGPIAEGLLTAGFMLGILWVLASGHPVGSVARVGPRAAARRLAWWVRVFARHLGLAPGVRALPRIAGAGVLAAGAAVVVALVVTNLDWLEQTDYAHDPRYVLARSVPGIAGPVFSGLSAGPHEEVLFRGCLLLGAAGLAVACRTAAARRVGVVALLLLTSVVFASGHVGWSAANAVIAGVGGIFYGVAALRTGSLWAPVLAHTLYNVAAGILVL